MKKLLLTLFLPIASLVCAQEDIEIQGKVTSSEDNLGIPGVSIVVKGTTRGTITDNDGNYTLNAGADETLVFSYIGFNNEEVPVRGRSEIDVVLIPEIQKLSEIVVVGYGTKKKRDVIGSVSSVKSEELNNSSTPDFGNALQGKAAGVHVTSQGGVPGSPVSIKVRGINSISSATNPLWIIDGMPIYNGGRNSDKTGGSEFGSIDGGLEKSIGTTGQSPMSLINPNDIESIEVLKDAAATAIYGSRGSNGVIIITTKTGQKGKSSSNIDYSTGISTLTRTPEDIGYVNADEWFMLADKAVQNLENDPEARFEPNRILVLRETFSKTNPDMDNLNNKMSREEANVLGTTDWFDKILRTGTYHDVNFSTSQSFDKINAYLSVNYRNDQSIYKHNQLERVSGRLNLDFTPVESLTTGAKMNMAYTKNNRIKTDQNPGAFGTGGGRAGGFGAANRGALPWFPVYHDNDPTGYWSPASSINLVANIDPDYSKDVVEKYRGIGMLYLEYRLPFVDGLSIRSEGAFDIIQANSIFWVNQYLREDNSTYAFDRAATRNSLNYNVYATYNKTIGNHEVNVVFGGESQNTETFVRDLEGKDLIGTYKELGSPGSKLTMSGKLKNETYLRAFFGRAEYKFLDRYLAGISLRRDGSSKFMPDYRWGTFTAFSLGWIMSEESFFKQIPVINFMKLRGSFGQTGNESIPANKTVTTYSNNFDNRYGYDDVIAGGTHVNNLGNPSITWETTNSYDVGIDYGLIQNRISGSLAYYIQKIEDLLLKAPLPPSTGLSGSNIIWGNIGDMQNQGWEFNVSSTNINRGKFKWTVDFNISTNENKVLKLTKDLDQAGSGIQEPESGSEERYITKKDGHLKAFFMADYAGIDKEKGVEMIWEIDVNKFEETGITEKTGRKIPATVDNLEQHKFIHKSKTPFPTWFGGITNTFFYGPFDLNVHFSMSGGNYIYDYNLKRTSYVHNGQNVIRKDLIGNHWKEPGDDAKYPQLVWNSKHQWGWDPNADNAESPTGKGDWTNNNQGNNYSPERLHHTKFLYKGDYIRLKTLQVGYNLPASISNTLKIQGLRIYLSGTNLWTWCAEYPGYDPEGPDYVDGVGLPNLKTYSIGLSLKF